MTYRIKTLMMHIITNTGSKKFSESVSYYVLNTINSCNNVRVVLVCKAVARAVAPVDHQYCCYEDQTVR